MKSRFDWVQFIQNEENTGFSKANNMALSKSCGKYILFLNPDTLLKENTIAACFDVFEKYAQCGALGVRMLDGNGKFLAESKRAIPSASNTFYKLSGMASLFPRSKIFNNYALGNLQEEKLLQVPVLSGAFMMVEKKILEKTGGFDESYFMYGEDIDLSYRISQGGYENMYAGNISIIHFKGESTNKNQSQYAKRFYGAMDIFVSKHYAGNVGALKKIFLSAGIFSASLFYKLKIFFNHSTTKQKSKTSKVVDFILTGDAAGMEEAHALLLKNNIQENRISKSQTIESTHEQRTTAIIFCIGLYALEDAMNIMQQHPNAAFYFHYTGSESIVGSSDKNNTGIFYAR